MNLFSDRITHYSAKIMNRSAVLISCFLICLVSRAAFADEMELFIDDIFIEPMRSVFVGSDGTWLPLEKPVFDPLGVDFHIADEGVVFYDYIYAGESVQKKIYYLKKGFKKKYGALYVKAEYLCGKLNLECEIKDNMISVTQAREKARPAMRVDGRPVLLDTRPVIIDGRTYVPLGPALARILDTEFRFSLNSGDGSVSFTLGGDTLEFTVNSSEYLENGKTRSLPHEIFDYRGYMMIPLLSINRISYRKFAWNADNFTVYIYDGKQEAMQRDHREADWQLSLQDAENKRKHAPAAAERTPVVEVVKMPDPISPDKDTDEAEPKQDITAPPPAPVDAASPAESPQPPPPTAGTELVEGDEDIDVSEYNVVAVERIENEEAGYEEIIYYIEETGAESGGVEEIVELDASFFPSVVEARGELDEKWIEPRAVSRKIRAYARREWISWEEAEDEISILLKYYPYREQLRLDYAETLEKTMEWQRAMQIYDDMLLSGKDEAALIRAFESRRDLRRRFGDSAGFSVARIEPLNGKSTFYTTSARKFFNRRFSVTMEWTSGDYAGADTFSGVDYSANDAAYNVDLRYYFDDSRDVRMSLGGISNDYESDKTSLGIEYRSGWRRFGGIAFGMRKSALWREPPEASDNGGYYDLLFAEYECIPGGAWFCSATVSKKKYYIRGGEYYGSAGMGTAEIGKTVLKNETYPLAPLRSVDLSLRYTRTDTSVQAAYGSIIDLHDKTSVMELDLTIRLLFNHRTSLDITGFAGHDGARNLEVSDLDLYGFRMDLYSDITADMVLFADWEYVSENPVSARGGSYWRANAGVTRFFTSSYPDDTPAGD